MRTVHLLAHRAKSGCCAAVASIAIVASSAHAATIAVTDNSTFVGANVGCSLARAVSYINAGGPTDAFNYCTNSEGDYGVLDTIEFSLGSGTPAITVTNNSVTYIEIPTIRKPVLINGATGGA